MAPLEQSFYGWPSSYVFAYVSCLHRQLFRLFRLTAKSDRQISFPFEWDLHYRESAQRPG